MPLYTPKHVVLNWYLVEASPSLELMESFVEGVEHQVGESIAKYDAQPQVRLIGNDNLSITLVHQGLDGESWDLDGIFTQYFPSLQRRSALLTLYSFFEFELNKLCQLFRSEKQFSLEVNDLKSEGIDRSTLYLEKVAGLNTKKTSSEWVAVKNVQALRNIIVHRDGKLRDQDKALSQFVEKNEFLRCNPDGEVVLERGFLTWVVATFKNYFKLLDTSLRAQST